MGLFLILAVFLCAIPSSRNTAFAQTTSFTYQGKLTDSSAPINALYDFILTLWDAPTNGNQIGVVQNIQNVAVVDGIFSLALDFGAGAFNGSNRFLEISVKPSGNPIGFPTLLSPRQPVLSTPYAIKSLAATSADGLSVNCVNCVTSSQIQSVTASQISSGTLASARGGTGLGSTGAAGNYLRSDGTNWTTSALLASDVSGTVAVSKGGTGLSVPGAAGNFLRSDGTNWASSALQASDLPDLGNGYVKNGSTLQSGAEFNISGNGTAGGTLGANVVNSTTQYNIAGARILSRPGTGNLFVGANTGIADTGSNNSFVGSGAGQNNGSGSQNAFFGAEAGFFNVSGGSNSFFGWRAGYNNVGNNNSFFGKSAGLNNSSGFNNAFFGKDAGFLTSVGTDNSFFGYSAGSSNNSSFNSFFGSGAGSSNLGGGANSFFGYTAGQDNSSGTSNSFFGKSAGNSNLDGNENVFVGDGAGGNNTSGNDNSFLGKDAGSGNGTGSNNTAIGAKTQVNNFTNATAIGYRASVSQSNSLVLGGISGVNFGTDTNVGIGTTAPNARFHIAVNGGNILAGGAGCNTGNAGIGFGASLTGCANYSLLGDGTSTFINRPTGGGIYFRENNTTQMRILPGGDVVIDGPLSVRTLAASGQVQLCRNGADEGYQISFCSSSLRYKKDLQPFTSGLALVNQLKPISFKWKSDNSPDLGFGAEDVATVEPLLVTRNLKGEVEGVKYDRITAVLVNAIKELQTQIEQQRGEIEAMRDWRNKFDALKNLICRDNSREPACRQD